MTIATISPKYQFVIPKQVREKMNISVGMKMIVIPYLDRIELVVKKPIKKLRGVLTGMDTSINREEDRI